MSLAGSMASMTARMRIVGGSGIWTMTPSTGGVGVEFADGGGHAGLGGLAVELDEAGVDADLGAAAQDPLEIDHRGRVPADDQDPQPGGRPRTPGTGDAIGDGAAELVGDRRALEQTSRARRHRQAAGVGGSRVAGLGASDRLVGLRGETLDLGEKIDDRAVIVPSNEGPRSTAG